MQKILWVVLTVMVFAFTGCLDGGVKLEVQYDDMAGIQKGDRVLSENVAVGVVTKIETGENADGPGSVFISVNKKRADTVTENTRFYIDKDPEKEERQTIVLKRFRPGGEVLASGAVVQGSDRSLSAFHELADELGAGLGSLKAFFEGLKDDLEKGSESDAAKKFGEELSILAQKMEKSSEQWKQQFQEDVLPELQKQFESLRESLEALGQSEEVQKLKQKLEGLSQT